MRSVFTVLVMCMLLLSLLSGCEFMKEECYSQVEVGENFGGNIDGHFKKLPHNYCLMVLLGSKARLFRVPEDMVDASFFTNGIYNTPALLEGHFIKGIYTAERLVLCEELEDDTLQYITFDFVSGEIQYHTDVKEVYERLQIDTDSAIEWLQLDLIDWFSLCNTNEEIRAVQ